MKTVTLFAVLSISALTLAGDGAGRKLTFDAANVGTLPRPWKAAKTGQGSGGDWKIVKDKDAPGGLALAQTKPDKKALFNICVAEGTKYQNLDLSVDFKAIAGASDQGGGPVWRFQDENNYYVARMNPLEDNFRLYKVVAGKRIQLASVDIQARAGKWHTIRVVHQGDRIECYLNGKKYLAAQDATFPNAGAIGVWTKADAQTRFAGLSIRKPRG